MNVFRSLWLLAACSVLSACASLPNGASQAPATVADYNQAIVHSKDEQLLLNLVRLRYRDSTQFLQATGVTDSHAYGASAGTSTYFPFRDALSELGITALGNYSRRPVVTMAPMNEADFATALLSPLSAADLGLLAGSGWSIERILLCCVERIGNLSNSSRVSGPTPDVLPDNSAFRQFAKQVRELQRSEEMSLVLDGSRASFLFYGDGLDDGEAIASRFGAKLADGILHLRPVTSPHENGIAIQTRSILGSMYALSHNVGVPDEHVTAGLVTSATAEAEATPDWGTYSEDIFRIRSGREAPLGAFVAVPYRDHWFWIDDADLNSKTTFSLLNYLINLRSVSGGAAPLLTVGVD